jgi:hypothetical protein
MIHLPSSIVGAWNSVRLIVVVVGATIATFSSSAKGVIAPFSAGGRLSRKVFKPGELAPYIQTEANFSFHSSNDWWEAEVRYLNPSPGSPSVDNFMKVPGGVRGYFRFANELNKGMPGSIVCPIAYPSADHTEAFAIWLSLCPNPDLPLIDARRMRRFLPVPGCNLDLLNRPENEGSYAVTYLKTACFPPSFVEFGSIFVGNFPRLSQRSQ